MRYTISITQTQYDLLRAGVFAISGVEGAAYLLCGISRTDDEMRLLVREVVTVSDRDYLVREPMRLSITSQSYVAIAKRATAERVAVIFVHSHPNGIAVFSDQDNREEPKLMRFFSGRSETTPHGSLVVADPPEAAAARVWVEGSWAPVNPIRVIGERYRFIGNRDGLPIPEFFDRQVRAFGADVQRLLGGLHIGVVGAGGVGSAIIEQLARLGIRKLSIFDGDTLDPTNINRVYGSKLSDAGRNKAVIAGEHIRGLGLQVDVRVFDRHITAERTAEALRDCEVVFGCTDKETPRGILVGLATRYLIPVIDLGVKIESASGIIGGVYGRVTVVQPSEACLFCRGRISAEGMRLESHPDSERKRLHAEGYAPELDINNPAVISFTTGVAAQGVSELLHRLTGFMGSERNASESLLLVHEDLLRTNRAPQSSDCVCSKPSAFARGDGPANFLGLTWAR